MPSHPDLLPTTKLALRILIGLNILLGALIFALLATSFISLTWLQDALGFRPETPSIAIRLVMLIGLLGIPLANLLLTRLLAMVATVGEGDPFIPENAQRLLMIARSLLGLQLLNLAMDAACAAFSLKFGPESSLEGWLAVLLLFVLARVFDYGTRLRADLAGTV